MINVLCDVDIPYLSADLSNKATIIPYHAGELTAAMMRRADALIVRSVTPVTEALLAGSPVRWVGSVTAGINHLDQTALKAKGIRWHYAPGANAPAVVEYIFSALWLARQQGVIEKETPMALIGVGEVGSRVVTMAKALGLHVVPYDPPREQRDAGFVSADHTQVLACEFVIVCASYTVDGAWPSHHWLDQSLLTRWEKLRGVVNTARGEIIDYDALLAMKSRWTCLDVWPSEPQVKPHWVANATRATPHIAGYSRQSKWRLSQAIYRAFCQDFFSQSATLSVIEGGESCDDWGDWAGISNTSEQMKDQMSQTSSEGSETFHQLRRQYPLREEKV